MGLQGLWILWTWANGAWISIFPLWERTRTSDSVEGIYAQQSSASSGTPLSLLSSFASYGGCEGSSLVLERGVVLGVILWGWAFNIIQWSWEKEPKFFLGWDGKERGKQAVIRAELDLGAHWGTLPHTEEHVFLCFKWLVWGSEDPGKKGLGIIQVIGLLGARTSAPWEVAG